MRRDGRRARAVGGGTGWGVAVRWVGTGGDCGGGVDDGLRERTLWVERRQGIVQTGTLNGDVLSVVQRRDNSVRVRAELGPCVSCRDRDGSG